MPRGKVEGALWSAAVVSVGVAVLLSAVLAPVGGQNNVVHLGVLLNSSEQFDPLVEMGLTQMYNSTVNYYRCNDTMGPNATIVPENGNWTAVCDAPGYNMTSLNITNLVISTNSSIPGAIPIIPNSISNIFTLTNLKMSNIGLVSSLPSTLGFMGFMNYLDLSYNQLNFTLPGTLFILTTLTSLKLNSNLFNGSVSTALAKITTLQHIDMSRNYLSGDILGNLNNLTSLTYLNISGYPSANTTCDAASIQLVTNAPLGSGFSGNLSAEAPQLANLTQLQVLDMSNNPCFIGNVSDFPWPAWNSSLQYLNMVNTSLVGPFPTVMFQMGTLVSMAPGLESLCPAESVEVPYFNGTIMCKYCSKGCFTPVQEYKFPLPAIIGIVVGCAALVMVALIGAYYFLRARRFSDGVEVHGVRRFTLPELEEATNQYSEQLGKGGFGEVYKGVVAVEGAQKEVAVKRTKAERRKNMKKFDSGFRNEILVLSGVRHRNLVELVGYSSKGADVLLVYEFIVQGSVDDLLKKEVSETTGEGVTALTWERRLKVAFGAAQGLDYLHSGVTPPIIHRDIKSSNILVDEEFVAKVADFGLSKIRPELDLEAQKSHGVQKTMVKGTLGYIDPEYAATLKPTERSDVYAFGVVLLELATGWRPVGGPERKHIIQRVAKGVNSSGFDSILAPTIKKEIEGELSGDLADGNTETMALVYSGDSSDGQNSGAEIRIAAYTPELFQRFVKLAMQCCAKDSSTRPSMRTVAKALGEMIEGKAEDPADSIQEERFDEEGGEEVVLLTHNLGGEAGATVAFVMETQVGPR